MITHPLDRRVTPVAPLPERRPTPRPLRRAVAAAAAFATVAGLVLVPSSLPVSADAGAVYGFGSADDHGEPGAAVAEVAGIAAFARGEGYLVATRDGGVHAHGDASFHGSMHGTPLAQPVVGIAAHPTGDGYWMVARDGGIFSFGAAEFFGSTGDIRLNQPIVGMSPTPTGEGYWMVASDGGIFSFGDARFLGSMGHTALNSPVVDIATTPSGDGYWMVAADGGMFSFGDAVFRGSAADSPSADIVGMDVTPSGDGYWLATEHGGIFAFGDAGFHGSFGETSPQAPVTDIAARPTGDGYWLVTGKPEPAPEVHSASVDPRWDRLAECESGGNWSINTGNGYYGGLQFSLSSWRAVGGTGYPHQHSRLTQIEMAERLRAQQGWGAWPHCSRKLGYR